MNNSNKNLLESLKNWQSNHKNIPLLTNSNFISVLQTIVNLTDPLVKDIENLRVLLLGKNGLITNSMKSISNLNVEEKKIQGKVFNIIKQEIINELNKKKHLAETKELNQKLQSESIDVTLPVNFINKGKLHPVSYVIEQVVSIFSSFGFTVEEGPEIEDEWYNFTSLNFSENHPAKDDHDTFYFKSKINGVSKLLRTHTSSVQIRTMQNNKPPIKIIAPGRVYRSDDDATHTPVFHQVEGLYIDKKVTLAELKGVINAFCSYFFEIENVPLRFRPSYFPFTEPSLEVDIGCKRSKERIEIGKGSDWLEILGCGMVHPNVLINCGLDPNEYSGFAFGMGIERITMLKYGFADLRAFFNVDYKWIQNYGFNVLKSPSIEGGFD